LFCRLIEEGLGISIIEASAMEKPVVATNIRGLPGGGEDGITGKLIPPGDHRDYLKHFCI